MGYGMTTYVEGVTAIIHSFDFCIPRDRIVLFSLVLRSNSRKTTFPFFPHRRALFRRRGRGRTGGGFVSVCSIWWLSLVTGCRDAGEGLPAKKSLFWPQQTRCTRIKSCKGGERREGFDFQTHGGKNFALCNSKEIQSEGKNKYV